MTNDPDVLNGGNTQLNPENAPMNITDAGRAFLDSLSGAQEAPTGASEQDNDPNYVDIPEPVGNEPNAPAAPSFDPSALEGIKNSIIAEIQSLRNNSAEPGQVPPQTEGEPEPQNNVPEINDDEFMERFSENPVQAVMELANKIADEKVKAEITSLGEKIQPLLDESEKIAYQNKVREVVAEFAKQEDFADAQKYFPQMAQTIREKGLPQDDLNTYVNTYKDLALQDLRSNRGKSLDDYLADDNEVSKVISNPKIRNAVIEQYLKEIQSGAKPQVITGGGNSTPAATPPTDIRTFADAQKIFKNQL